ncbi:hypothetical protein FQN49_006396, partial [Arthroderma sp. PD_2]
MITSLLTILPVTECRIKVGGLALSYSVIQLTVLKRLSDRKHQQELLREQIDTLNNISMSAATIYNVRDKTDYAAALARRGYAPREGPTTADKWKLRWNQEVGSLARNIHEFSWEDVRE